MRIALSLLTGRIYAGRLNKAGDSFVGNKTDVTSDVLRAVIEKCGVDETVTVHVNGKPAFEIRVTKLKAHPHD